MMPETKKPEVEEDDGDADENGKTLSAADITNCRNVLINLKSAFATLEQIDGEDTEQEGDLGEAGESLEGAITSMGNVLGDAE